MMTTGEKIRQLIKEQGKTQREVAERLHTTEVTISRYCRGERTPRGPHVAALANELGTTADYLLGTETETETEAYCTMLRYAERFADVFTNRQKLTIINTMWRD